METYAALIWMGISLCIGFLVAAVIFTILSRSQTNARVDLELAHRKDQFISLASHYLLNPITVIQTALSRLQEKDTEMTTEQRNVMYEAIFRGQQRLWIVTQQMIMVGEIDQGNLRLQLDVADLYDTVSGAVAAIDPFAREKNVSIHIEDHTQDIREARIDRRRMKLALIALIDNAVKFSSEGGKVLVTMSLNAGVFSILVQDAGIGMSKEVLSHAMEKFFRGTEMYTFDYEGLGLGLHTAQAILRLHQGNITIDSVATQGTAVRVDFPQV